jgi:hypothetical protein
MESPLTEEQRTAETRWKIAPITRSRWIVLALLGLLSCGRIAQADGLRWNLKPGEVLRYAVEEKMTQTSKAMDKESKGSTTRTINLSWSVKGVSDSGDADISLRFDRIRMHIEQPPFMPYDLDSRAGKIDAPEPFASMAQQFKAMAGAEFTFKLKPNGAIEAFQIPENTLKTLRAGIPEGATQGMFSEQALKDMFLQSTPPPFPENARNPGSSWSSKPAKIPSPLGNVVVDKSFTTVGPDPKNSDLLLIGTQTTVSIEPQSTGEVSAKISSQEGKGSMIFDMASGRIVSTRLDQKMQMQISQAADPSQKIDQTTETTSTMTLER